MSDRSTRRAVLATLATCASAGCTAIVDSGGDAGGSVTERPGPDEDHVTATGSERTEGRAPSTASPTTVAQGTADLPTRLWFEAASLPESERGSVDAIAYADLSSSERQIVGTALDAGEYTVATERESAALESIRDRIEERTGNGETLVVYLRRNESYYRVGFAAGDHIIAHPDM